jgi:orotate phosphoribosyltransferase
MEAAKKALLLDYLVTHSFLTGDFTLSSGKKSSYYFDFRAAASDPESIKLVGELFFQEIANYPTKIDCFGGAIFGAAPMVTSITIESYLQNAPMPGFYVRKEPKKYGTANYVEGRIETERELSVVMIEDVITTGGSILRAIEHLQESAPNCKVVQVMALLDRKEGGRENIEKAGYPIWSLFTIDDLFAAADKRNGSAPK